MNITKTSMYKCILACPYFSLGHHYDRNDIRTVQYEDYPKIFIPVYKFENGTEITERTEVFRIINNINNVPYIKPVKFDKQHLSLEIFPTKELAQIELDKLNEVVKSKSNFNDFYGSIEQICLRSDSYRKFTIDEIEAKFQTINEIANDLLTQLKEKNHEI